MGDSHIGTKNVSITFKDLDASLVERVTFSSDGYFQADASKLKVYQLYLFTSVGQASSSASAVQGSNGLSACQKDQGCSAVFHWLNPVTSGDLRFACDRLVGRACKDYNVTLLTSGGAQEQSLCQVEKTLLATVDKDGPPITLRFRYTSSGEAAPLEVSCYLWSYVGVSSSNPAGLPKPHTVTPEDHASIDSLLASRVSQLNF